MTVYDPEKTSLIVLANYSFAAVADHYRVISYIYDWIKETFNVLVSGKAPAEPIGR